MARLISLFLLLVVGFTAKAQVACTVLKNETCGSINGIFSAVASFGTGPYTYSIDGGATYQNSGYFSQLGAGNYMVLAKDASGVTATGTCAITNSFNSPSLNVSTVNPTSCLTPDGKITAFASGGLAPYQYSLDGKNWQSNATFTNLPSGSYMVIVRDANGCIKTQWGVSIGAPCPPTNGTVYIISVGCSTKGSITFEKDANSSKTYLFSLDGVNYQTSNTFSNLDEGVYHLYIKDVLSGDISLQGFTVTRGCGLSALNTVVHATCAQPTGTITSIAQNGEPPYRYSLDGLIFQNNGVFSNLSPGNYTVIVMDDAGFVTSEVVAVYDGCINVSVNARGTTCGYNNGKLTVTATGGSAPYNYSIDGTNFQTSNIFSPLPPGNYQVTVSDKYGLKGTANATVNGSLYDLGVTVNNVQPATCIAGTGSLTITGFGGIPPYEYSIDEINYQASNTFNNLYYGQYKVGVRDATGCTFFMYPVYVPYVCFRVTGDVVDARCGNNNGSIKAIVVDGVAPYQYTLNGINYQTSPDFYNLAPGIYTVKVIDATNASAVTQVTVGNNCLSIASQVINSSCGKTNGSITVTATNGATPYTYAIDGINFQTNNSFTGLAAGGYIVTVKDNNGLTATAGATIVNVPGPQVTATATFATCDDNDGVINISANGGTSPLMYSITGDNFQSGSLFNNVSSGSHQVFVKDANGCVTSEVVNVPLQNNLTLTAGNDTIICKGSSVQLFASSNASVFSWAPAASLSNGTVKDPVASPTSSTQYTITASRGACNLSKNVSVAVRPAPVAEAGPGETICFGKSSQLHASGGLHYSWTPATFLSDASVPNPMVTKPANSITYSLSVTDANNCTSLQKDAVTITVTAPAKLFAGNDTSVAVNQPFRLMATDVNNSGFTAYDWFPDYGLNNPHTASPVSTLDKDITYKVSARTDAGCESNDQLTIKVYKGPDIYVPNAFTPNNDGRNELLIPLPIGLKQLNYFVVFNRWGQQVYRTTAVNRGWDGKINGVAQPTNTYTWMAEATDLQGNIIRRRGVAVLIR